MWAKQKKSTPESTRRLRARLVQEGSLVSRDSRYQFERGVLFATPSSAASVVLGGSANGRIELVDKAGRTFKIVGGHSGAPSVGTAFPNALD